MLNCMALVPVPGLDSVEAVVQLFPASSPFGAAFATHGGTSMLTSAIRVPTGACTNGFWMRAPRTSATQDTDNTAITTSSDRRDMRAL